MQTGLHGRKEKQNEDALYRGDVRLDGEILDL
jgi:hypothetical protein